MYTLLIKRRLLQYVIMILAVALYFSAGASAWAGGASEQSAPDQMIIASTPVEDETVAEDDAWKEDDNWDEEWDEEETIADPLEPLNRVFFHFNDKFYYWVLKPVAKVYSAVIAEDIQIAIRNFFENLKTPTRAVNSLLQGQVHDSSVEVARFFINTTAGILGFADVAKENLGWESYREDTGQTFGYYGAGGGFYICIPFLGPSNFRDAIGLVGDGFLHPAILLDADWEVLAGIKAFETVNHTALTLGDYELLVETAVDPYTSVKDVYQQYRNGLIKE
jgi:phospholipid-binding lipoprotein MlaA